MNKLKFWEPYPCPHYIVRNSETRTLNFSQKNVDYSEYFESFLVRLSLSTLRQSIYVLWIKELYLRAQGWCDSRNDMSGSTETAGGIHLQGFRLCAAEGQACLIRLKELAEFSFYIFTMNNYVRSSSEKALDLSL